MSAGNNTACRQKAKIHAGVLVYREYFAKTTDKSWDEIKQYAMSYVPVIEETMPEVLEEARGIAGWRRRFV